MKKLSIIALLAALAVSSAYAQDVTISTEVGVDVSVSAPDISSAVSSVVSDVSSAVSEASSEASSAVSEASSEMASSEMSSEASSEMSSASMSSSGMENNCDNLDISTMTTTGVDQAALDAVTSVTVFAVDDCSGLGDLATMDATALTMIGTNLKVTDALAMQGQAGGEIIGYLLEDKSLTVYVRSRNQ